MSVPNAQQPAPGQIWQQVGTTNYYRIVRWDRRGVSLQAVIAKDGEWRNRPHTRIGVTDVERFDGRKGGFEFFRSAPL